jgi:hypothetical protein
MSDSIEEGSSAEVDPLVGNWGSLMPLVAKVGVIVRRLRSGGSRLEFGEVIEHVETGLLQWGDVGRSRPSEHDMLSDNSPTDFDNIAEAYRLSSLLTLYSFCPHLIGKRVTLLNGGETTSGFLSRLASSIIALLQQIPVRSRLLRVCSLPILSAGQFVTEATERDFLRSMTDVLTHKTRLSTIHCVRKLLENVWSRRDAGVDVWWMDILDEGGTTILIN